MNICKKMRTLLKDKDYIFTPGIANPLQAMIVERVGFDFVYMGGYDTALVNLGLPDVGLITETEMVTNARNIARAVNIPVLADADTGYGNAINVIQTVRDYEAAGVAGIHLEDQVSPKRCAHIAGKMLIPIEEAVGKIRAAVDARKDEDFIIIARIDAIGAVGGGFDEALRRGRAYARAGADIVWCIFPSTDIEYPKKFAKEMHKDFPNLPLHFHYTPSFKWHNSPLKFSDIAEMGYKEIHIGAVGLRTGMQALWDYSADLKKRGEATEIEFEKRIIGHPTEDYHKFVGFPAIKELEKKYLPKEEVRKKYEESIGYGRDEKA